VAGSGASSSPVATGSTGNRRKPTPEQELAEAQLRASMK
jgi:hypothetical protein